MSLYSPEPNSSEMIQLKYIRIAYIISMYPFINWHKPSRLKANFFSSDASKNNIVKALKKYIDFRHLHDVLMLIWKKLC